MIQTTITLYQFTELDEAVQKRLVAKRQEIEYRDYDGSRLSDMFKERLEERGYPTDKIEWSLSFCQGDGVAFYGVCDVEKLAQRLLPEAEAKAYLGKATNEGGLPVIELVRNDYGHHYSHWNTMSVSADYHGGLDDCVWWMALHDKFVKAIIEDKISTSKELESLGYEDIAYFSTEEYARERLVEEEDLLYLPDGTRWHGAVTPVPKASDA